MSVCSLSEGNCLFAVLKEEFEGLDFPSLIMSLLPSYKKIYAESSDFKWPLIKNCVVLDPVPRYLTLPIDIEGDRLWIPLLFQSRCRNVPVSVANF